VRVTRIVPARVDSSLVRLASSAFLGDLAEAAVRVLLYESGLLHTKSMTVDGEITLIGSANMDMRSFRLNFELNAFVYDRTLCDEMAAQFDLDLAQASEFTFESAARTPYPRKLAQQTARLMSPLL